MNEYYRDNEEKFGAVSSYLYRFIAEPFLGKYYRIIVDDLVLYRPVSVLDIGFGTGSMIIRLGKILSSDIYGVEPSEFMFRITQKRLNKLNLNSAVKIFRGSSRNIPLDKEFDLIFSTFSFHHWDKNMESIPYIMKFTSEKGRFIIYDYDNEKGRVRSSHGLTSKEFPVWLIERFKFHFYHLRNTILKVEIEKN